MLDGTNVNFAVDRNVLFILGAILDATNTG